MELEARRVSVFFYGTFMNPGVLAEYGIIAGDLALALCEDRGFGEVLPISDSTKEAFLKLPVLRRPDRMWRWRRPGDEFGVELIREYQRSLLDRLQLRTKLEPYFGPRSRRRPLSATQHHPTTSLVGISWHCNEL